MSRKTLTTLAVIVVAAAATNSAFAGCGGKTYYGGSNLHHKYISSHNHGVYKTTRVVHHDHVVRQPVIVEKPVIVEQPIIDNCHHPKFCLAYVQPGETLLTICAREYGNPNAWIKVSEFNGIPAGAPLAVGQPIKLPTIYDSGRMIPSDSPAPPAPAIAVSAAPAAIAAPAPTGFAAPNGFAAPAAPAAPAPAQQFGAAPQMGMPQGQPGMPQQGFQQEQQQLPQGQPQGQPQQQMNGGQSLPQMNIRQAQRVTPTFTAGSQLVLDGQQFGGTPGQVQLVIGPMTLPVAIANWTPSELTIQLPELPLSKASDARVVILNAEGKLVTQSEIRLTPASSRLAMGN